MVRPEAPLQLPREVLLTGKDNYCSALVIVITENEIRVDVFAVAA